MTKMGPAVLPLSEKLLFALNWMVRRLPGGHGIKPYIPDFRRAFDHFCLHAGSPLLRSLSSPTGSGVCASACAHTGRAWYHSMPHFCAATVAAKARPPDHQDIHNLVCYDQMFSHWLTVTGRNWWVADSDSR